MKKLNDFMLDANKALPDVLRFWVYFLLGLALSRLMLGELITCIIFGAIVVIEAWALVVEIVREHKAEKERQEIMERMVNDPESVAQAFNNLKNAISGVFNGKEEDDDC